MCRLVQPCPARAAVLAATAGLLSLGVTGSVNIAQQFDPNKMLPADSYLR